MANVKTQLIIEGKNNSKKAFDEVTKQLDGINTQLSRAGKAVVAAFSFSQLTGAIRGIANIADNYGLMNARLKLATDSQAEFTEAQSELRRIATATQAPLESLVTLYGRISRPLKEAGRSQSEILKVTEAVATSFRVSGASAQEAENGVIQFAQALGSGALRGDEFNSVAEQAPRLMQALAKALGVPTTALKEMAKQGELTADVVTDALVSQLDVLRKEAESLPETVGGAMTELSDRWNEAIGKADMKPLIEAIKQLGETLSDPVVVDNLVKLASALASLAAVAVEGGSELVDLGKKIAFVAADSQGLVTELDQIDAEIADIDRSIKGTGLSTTLGGLWFSKEELEAKRKALVSLRSALVEEQSGINSEMQALAQQAANAAEALRNEELADYGRYAADLQQARDKLVKDAKNGGNALIAAEKSANAELKKIRSDRLKIEQEFSDSIARTRAGAGGEATFGGAMDLKLGAKQALGAKDGEAAIRQAREALKVLEELEQSGANTYGFVGIKEELQAIALAGNQLQQEQVQAELDGVKKKIEDVEAAAAKLKDLPVSVKADEASMEKARSDIQRLAEMLGNTEIVLPVRIQHPDGPIIQDLPAPPGFATGGMIRGAGSGTSDSILARLSNGEFVMRAAAVKHYGPQLMAMMNGLQLPKFADGGLVEAAAAVQPSGPGRDLGRVELALPGGEKLSLLADGENFDRIVRRTAMKRGRTRVN